MPSATIPLRRSRVSDEEDEEEESNIRVSRRPSPPTSQDSRTHSPVDGSPSGGASPVLPASYQSRRGNTSRAQIEAVLPSNGEAINGGKHQPGAIVRVKMNNFVTYDEVEFYPGPNLNMVIGPNGTGKSSLVCAICLGLGYQPKLLGRAQNIGEFVKHGADEAVVEIELENNDDDEQNHIISVRIIREGDKRRWRINGAETTHKAVQALTRQCGIQIDNLCQFLPQDRVSEFAGLSPVELLHETQRAAAPDSMLQWHEKLKSLRRNQKDVQIQLESEQESLQAQEGRQENLRADVEKVQERARVEERIKLLERSLPIIKYRSATALYHSSKNKSREAKERLRTLETRLAPALEAVNAKENYQSRIRAVVTERQRFLEESGRIADRFVKEIDDLGENIQTKESERDTEQEAKQKRNATLRSAQRKIRELELRLENEKAPEFVSSDWNAKIRAIDQKEKLVAKECDNIKRQIGTFRNDGATLRASIEGAEKQLVNLDSQQGKRDSKLRQLSRDTATAWEWIKANKEHFKYDIFGPPVVECQVSDARFIDAVEALFQRNDFLTITTQSKEDYRKLSDQLYKTMGLGEIKLVNLTGTPSEIIAQGRLPVSDEELQQYGFDGWALDYLEGPDHVLAMLCSLNLGRTALAREAISEDQYKSVMNSRIRNWVSGRQLYQVIERKEYGPQATSTTTKNVRNASVWTDQPVDNSLKQSLESEISKYRTDFAAMKKEVERLRNELGSLENERKELFESLDATRQEKDMLQKAAGEYQALPTKIEHEKENLKQGISQLQELRERLDVLGNKCDELVVQKTAACLKHSNQVAEIRRCFEDLKEAQVRLIEAESDVQALVSQNMNVKRQLDDERNLCAQLERDRNEAKATATELQNTARDIINMAGEQEKQYLIDLNPEETTADTLNHEISAERAKLAYMVIDNPDAVKNFEARQLEAEKCRERIERMKTDLGSFDRKIADLRQRWEPELDKLVSEISDAFSHNFQQIGCAGEVEVHKDEDFELWSIEIKVKFRENETLQLLNAQRQSGGERSVSTIFYLMSLQSLTRAPFRVVDEINQGMDPRNERMVHERMVEIACKEHTSQYFLITPKLLTGLKYDRRMKVLCIASGEHMPSDYRKLNLRTVLGIKRAMVAAG